MKVQVHNDSLQLADG